MKWFTDLLVSAAHNAGAAAIGTVVPVAISVINAPPTGGALDYANSHPWVLYAWGIASLVARDALKNVPAFAAAAGTTQPVSAPAGAAPKQS